MTTEGSSPVLTSKEHDNLRSFESRRDVTVTRGREFGNGRQRKDTGRDVKV